MGGLGPQKKGTVECLGCAECPVKRGVLQGGEEQGCRGTAGRSSTAAMPAGRVETAALRTQAGAKQQPCGMAVRAKGAWGGLVTVPKGVGWGQHPS